MPVPDASALTVVVMAKPATPGQVKTRLIGELTAEQAAAVHAAMLDCVRERVERWLPDARRVLAVVGAPPDPRRLADSPAGLESGVTPAWEVLDQGPGGLGERLERVWRVIGGGPVAFLGVDSPDVPADALTAIPRALTLADVALGPAEDGGYWTLAARELNTVLLRDIDWGTAAVYDQTRAAAAQAGLTMHELPRWQDIDTPTDLAALRARLEVATEPALVRLRDRLRRVQRNACHE